MTRAEREKERQEWETRIAEFRASGQSVSEWCAANGIKPGRLWYRLRQERRQGKVDRGSGVAPIWLQATVTGPACTEEQDNKRLIRIGEASVEVRAGFDPELLSGWVRVLLAIC
ncbi:MAG: helix-turn-helix domain-containing protein [Bacillota bacterium]